MNKKTPDGLRTNTALMVLADPLQLHGQHRRCWLRYHHPGGTFPQMSLPAPLQCRARLCGRCHSHQEGEAWDFMSEKPGACENLLSQPSAGKPVSEGVPPPTTCTWLSSTGSHRGAGSCRTIGRVFPSSCREGKKYSLEQLKAGCGKCWGCSVCGFEQGKWSSCLDYLAKVQ